MASSYDAFSLLAEREVAYLFVVRRLIHFAAEAIDQWFETFQNYEVTLEEMAAASLDVNFKEELSAIEQWFKVLSEAERTAALYSLLQHSTQVQIRFFITVLQQMARSDPMTALLSPAMGGSMQSQMEAKLASMSLKSPGLKSNLPGSPTTRNFSGSAIGGSSFLSPESANNAGEAAATLAQQRAKLKATNAAHRISAPVLSSTLGADRNTWGTGSNQLGQVDERSSSPAQEITISPNPVSRPKSTDFSGLANALKSPRGDEGDQLSPMPSGSWASMVNTPLIPIFKDTRNPGQSLDAAAQKLNDWNASGGAAVPLISDPPKKFNRLSKGAQGTNDGEDNQGHSGGNQRNVSGGLRSASGNGNLSAFGGQAGWGGARSPALSNTSNRYSDDGSMNGLGMAGFGMGMGNPGLAGLAGTGGFNMAALAAAGMAPVSPFNSMFNVSNLAAMGLTPDQMLAMQMAAAGQLGQLGQPGLSPFGMGMGMGMGNNGNMRGNRGMGGRGNSAKSPVPRSGEKKDDEDVDPKLLEDIPGWLRSLRLHKYTPNFEGISWRDMVMMDEAQLEAKGVAALGARRKMLKTFEVVRKKMGIEGPPGSA
ncbi:hypothetical protein LXA43DRAFT_749286 [Ganoderma leucocontextum]|nr:hypothetical protein LXA43DRAFT_749286 [Ganoderma leucocontextum]